MAGYNCDELLSTYHEHEAILQTQREEYEDLRSLLDLKDFSNDLLNNTVAAGEPEPSWAAEFAVMDERFEGLKSRFER